MDSRIASLDALRGVLALAVAIGHGLFAFGIVSRENQDAWGLLAPFAYLHTAVAAFFVLSGYVLATTYRQWFSQNVRAYRVFLIRRIARTWPLSAAALLALVPVYLLSPSETGTPVQFLKSLFFMSGPWGPAGIWNPPVWSLSVEWHLYLIFPALIWSISAIRAPGFALLIIGLSLMAFHAALFSSTSANLSPAILIHGLGAFIAGMGLSMIRTRSHPGLWFVVALTILALMYWRAGIYLVPMLTPALVYAVAQCTGTPPRWLTSLGAWSYSVYMIHYPVIFLLQALSLHTFGTYSLQYLHTTSPALSYGLLALYSAAIIGMARLSYQFLELPAQKFIRSRWNVAVPRLV